MVAEQAGRCGVVRSGEREGSTAYLWLRLTTRCISGKAWSASSPQNRGEVGT